MNLRINDYELRPYPGSTCWQLYKWVEPKEEPPRGVRIVDGKYARSLGRYPSTLRHGVGMAVEQMLMDGDEEVSVGEAKGRLLSLLDAIDEACDRLVEKVG